MVLLALAISSPLSAHTSGGATESFLSGFLHPILGFDHVVAMVAVGIWGAVLKNPAILILPLAFPLVMTVGGALGISGLELPMVETVIALSGVVLGALVMFYVRLPLAVATVIVAAFAIFHGFAHGQELPDAANPVGYSIGFVIGTGMLHLAGIGLGTLENMPQGDKFIRLLGFLTAAVGLRFLMA